MRCATRRLGVQGHVAESGHWPTQTHERGRRGRLWIQVASVSQGALRLHLCFFLSCPPFGCTTAPLCFVSTAVKLVPGFFGYGGRNRCILIFVSTAAFVFV